MKYHIEPGYPEGNQNSLVPQYSPQSKTSESSFHTYLGILIRGRLTILLSFIVIFGLTVVYIVKNKTQPLYEASATVAIRNQQQSLFMPMPKLSSIEINNELVVLRSYHFSRSVAQDLIDRKYIDPFENREKFRILEDEDGNQIEDVDEVAQKLRNRVSFEHLRDSDMIRITTISSFPKEAAVIADIFAERYYHRNMQASRAELRGARQFLEDQLKDRQEALYQAEDSLRKYMETYQVITGDAGAEATVEKITQLESTRNDVELELKALREKISSYEERLGLEISGKKTIQKTTDPYILQLQQEIASLEVGRDLLITQGSSSSGQEYYIEKITSINQQIEALQEKLDKRTNGYLESLVTEESITATDFLELKQELFTAQIELQTLETKKDILDSTIAVHQSKVGTLPKRSMEYTRLLRKRSSAEKLYLLVEEKYNEATIAEQSEFGNVEIIEPALIPNHPINSGTTVRRLLIGALFGLMMGVGIVFVQEYFNIQVRTPEDLKRHGYVILGTVPPIPHLQNKKSNGKKDEAGKEDQKAKEQLLSFAQSRSGIAEAYRQLRTHVQYSSTDESLQVLMMTSANPGEGKTTVSSNTAVAFAQANKKVLLIDADLRKPQIHRRFFLDKEPGLSNMFFMTEKLEDVIQKTSVLNLDIICSGLIPPNPSEMLGSQKMNEFLEQVKDMYDIVIFDSPPVLSVTDAVVLSTVVDGIIFVVESGKTTTDAVYLAMEHIENVKGRVLGVVLNNFDPRKAYGGYYYGNYYRYYYGNYNYLYGDKVKK